MVSHKELVDQKNRGIFGRGLALIDWLTSFVLKAYDKQGPTGINEIIPFRSLAIVHSLGYTQNVFAQ